MFRTKAKCFEKGEKPTRYLFNLEKKKIISKTITRLVENGIEYWYTNSNQILSQQKTL